MRARVFLLCLALLGSRPAHAGPVAAEPLVSLRVDHDRAFERGRGGLVSISVVPAPGLRLLAEGPLLVELEGRALDPARRRLTRQDAVDPRAESPRFELELRPHRDGSPLLIAKLIAWVCRGQRCRPIEQTLTLPLPLGAAPGAHVPPPAP